MKIKAFTLLELLVGMITTTIVIGSILFALRITSLLSLKVKQTISNNTELSLFHSTLATDFARCQNSTISKVEQQIVLNYKDENIRYSFLDSAIRRYKNGSSMYFNILGQIVETHNHEELILRLSTPKSNTFHEFSIPDIEQINNNVSGIATWLNE